jgi:putative hydrolase of HD superfamily
MKILLRKIALEDLKEYTYWCLPKHKYHEFNGPYFSKSTKAEIEVQIEELTQKIADGNVDPLPNKRIISNEHHDLIGEVNWYWKSKETNWMEVGLVIFDEQNWGKGIGYMALKLWIAELFERRAELVRIGITTWPGNHGMIRLAEKLGMKKEAQYRKARIVNEEYYDSISYGLLRGEWEAIM